jgi:large subunit ribosomal protein L6
MSRIGKRPVALPDGVTAEVQGSELSVKGPKGSLSMTMSDDVECKVADGEIQINPANDTRRARSYWGMQRTLAANLVEGVTEGFSKTLKLQLGFSHDVDYAIPEGIDIKAPDQTTVEISGMDKQQVGQVAAEIRKWRKPEPYKGKGIKYRGEYVFRKEGKKK